ncbi:hypothetical protein T492DRAFT_877439 [Pavlovales sp. CCMP2436]|nr:hypothetical protein T492DRAFT_877439 [Pavlovales sp. CCMP2436]
MEGKDLIAAMPTGGGKTLLYTLPPLTSTCTCMHKFNARVGPGTAVAWVGQSGSVDQERTGTERMEDNLDIDWDSEFTKVLNVGSTIKLICLSFELFVGQTASSAARAVLRELLRRGWVGVIVVDEADVVAIDGCEPGASYPRKPFRKVLSDLGPALVEMCRSLRVLRPPLAAITASLAPAHHSLLASALWLGAHGKERETVAVMCPLHQINLRLDVQTPDASHARAEQLASCVSDMVGKCLSGELGRAEGKVVLYFNTIAALKSSIAKIERAIRRDHGNVQGEGGGAARVRVFVCHAGPDEAVRTERERLFREDAPADVFFIYLATDVIGRGLNASDVLFVVHDGMPVHLSHVGELVDVLAYACDLRTCRHAQLQPHVGDAHPLHLSAAEDCCDNCARHPDELLSLNVTAAVSDLAALCSRLQVAGARPPLAAFLERAYVAEFNVSHRWAWHLLLNAMVTRHLEFGVNAVGEDSTRVSATGHALNLLAAEVNMRARTRLMMDVVARLLESPAGPPGAPPEAPM